MSLVESKTISVSIERPPNQVYEFMSNPENFPKWAGTFARSVRKTGGEWIVDTADGPMRIRFVEPNELGVLDHYVYPTPDLEILNPMRVVPNSGGSEVMFTLFRLPGMSDEKYAGDAAMVERDLGTLKSILEG